MGLSLQKVQALQESILFGDDGAALPEVMEMLNSGVSVNSLFQHRSALYLAILKDKTQIAELLLARGANIKLGYFTETPLHCAAERGNLRIAAKLLLRGAKVNARNHNGCTPLWLAASRGHHSLVVVLLQHPGVDVDCPCGDGFLKSFAKTSALCQAVQGQHQEVCRILLSKGANVNLSDINGCSPLHHACLTGNAQIARLLIQHGCSLNCVNKISYTPLHTAVSRNRCSVVDVLVSAGCDVNCPSSGDQDSSPLHLAARTGEFHIVAALCSAESVQVNRKDRRSMTPLIVACKFCNNNICGNTLNSSANINALEKLKLQPSAYSVHLWQDPRVKSNLQMWQRRLCDRQRGEGEVCAGRDKSGDSGCRLHGDAAHTAGQICETCQSLGCSKSSELDEIQSVILSAASVAASEQQCSHLGVLHTLITRGADLHPRDDSLNTALLYALHSGFQSALFLLCHGATILEEPLYFLFLNGRPAFLYPLVMALIWSSARHHHIFSSFCSKFSFNRYEEQVLSFQNALQQPMSLAEECRSVVRDTLRQKTSGSIAPLVHQLPVPKSMKQFLLLSDILHFVLCNSMNTE